MSLLLNMNQKAQIARTDLGKNIKRVPEGINEYKVSFLFYVLANLPYLTGLLISLILGMSNPIFMDILNPAVGKVLGPKTCRVHFVS